jgi:hypothetical protein
MRRLENTQIDIAIGSKQGEHRGFKLNDGIYNRFQIINRYNNNLNVPVQILIVQNGYDLVQRVDTRSLIFQSLNFYDSKAPIEVNGSQKLDIYLFVPTNLVEESSFEVIFWKEEEKC